MEDRKYPIGKFSTDRIAIPRGERISIIESFPEKITTLVGDLPDHVLKNTYRKGAWNIFQLVHHCADSHLNGLIRFKLALTENQPKILPYNQPAWALLPDAFDAPLNLSLRLLDGLHGRWTLLLNNMDETQYQCTFIHPENPIGTFTLDLALALYSWHCEHHYAHIATAIAKPA